MNFLLTSCRLLIATSENAGFRCSVSQHVNKQGEASLAATEVMTLIEV